MRTQQDCVFCKIVAGELPSFRIYEDDRSLAFMDINPANPGHALAISKEHWEDVYAIPDEVIGAVASTAKRVAKAVNEAPGPFGINLVQANGEGAGQSVRHFHIHIIPRAIGDELMMNWGPRPGEPGAIEEMAGRIGKALGAGG